MKLHSFLSSCLLSAGLVNLLPDLAQADSPVQKVLSSEAQGLNNTLSTITVWAGAGANLNFIPTGEIVKKVWLDDPSQIVLDFDGPMCMRSSGEDNCENSAATVVHLRRINTIKFPNLPQTASTLLSVITQTPRGERKLYQFRVAYGSGKPQHHTVAIYPDSQVPSGGTNGSFQAQLQNVELGLRVAKSRNLLGRSQGNQRLELRVQNFLALVSAGTTPQSAAQQTGVSLRLISKLASLGTTSAEAQQQTRRSVQSQTENLTKTSATTTQPRTELLPEKIIQQLPTPAINPPVPKLAYQRIRTDKPPQLAPAPIPKQSPVSSSISTSALSQQKEAVPVLPSNETAENLRAIDDATATAFGLTVARQKGQITLNSTTWKRAQGAIRQLRLGKNREEAARRSGIEMSVLSQLIKWGQTRP